jgi:hypothetical protein
VARQRAEIPALVKRQCLVVDAVEDHGDEGEGLTRVVAILQCPGEQATSVALTLIGLANAKPGKDGSMRYPGGKRTVLIRRASGHRVPAAPV